MIGEKTMTIF